MLIHVIANKYQQNKDDDLDNDLHRSVPSVVDENQLITHQQSLTADTIYCSLNYI